jgi:hypothetical protein
MNEEECQPILNSSPEGTIVSYEMISICDSIATRNIARVIQNTCYNIVTLHNKVE